MIEPRTKYGYCSFMGGNMIRKSRLITTMVMAVTILLLWSVAASGLNQIRLGCPVTMNPIVPGDSVSIPVYITNDVALGGFSLGFKWNNSFVKVTSVDFAGTAFSGLQLGGWNETHFGSGVLRVLFGWIDYSGTRPFSLHSSEVLLFTMNVKVLAGATSSCIDFDSIYIPPYAPFILAPVGGGVSITPNYVDCAISEIILGTPPYCPTHNDPPIAICQDVSVIADSTCQANAWIDNGSYDADSLDGVTLRQVPPGPYNPGDTTVLLIVEDYYGGVDTCQAVVHVEPRPGCPVQALPPVALCHDVYAIADSTCHAYASIDSGSYDPDSGSWVTLQQSPPGPYPAGCTRVTLTVTDTYGAKGYCQATVHVQGSANCPEDCYPPIALCREVYANVDSTCHASVSIDNGSYDPDLGSTVTSRQVPPGPYNLGNTYVKLIVTDLYGDADTCQTLVHVYDSLGPIIHCPPDIVKPVVVGHPGINVTYLPTAIDPCGPTPTVVTTPPSGSYFPVGTTTVTSIATTAAGGADTCHFSVQVVEVESICGDADGTAEIDISDAVYLIAYIFTNGPEPIPLVSGDANCDTAVDISDVVYLISFIFTGGPAPCAGC
jgi:hypothetical protein